MTLALDFLTVQAEVFNALGHPARLKILGLLEDGEACVCHIQAMLNLRQAYISQHLNVLKQAGLVTSRKDGLRVYYQISDERWREVVEQVRQILQSQREFQEIDFIPDVSTAAAPCTCPECLAKSVISIQE